jgi:tetratricopeptide (TPR) repeat protein
MSASRIDAEKALAKAWQLSKDERFEEAVELCDEVIAHHEDCYDAYSERSCNLHSLGRVTEALRDLEKLIELRPSSPTAYFRRARWRIERGEYELALKDLYQVLEFKVEYFDESVRFHLVIALLNTQRGDDAKRESEMLSPGFKEFVSTPSTLGKTFSREELILLAQQGGKI